MITHETIIQKLQNVAKNFRSLSTTKDAMIEEETHLVKLLETYVESDPNEEMALEFIDAYNKVIVQESSLKNFKVM